VEDLNYGFYAGAEPLGLRVTYREAKGKPKTLKPLTF